MEALLASARVCRELSCNEFPAAASGAGEGVTGSTVDSHVSSGEPSLTHTARIFARSLQTLASEYGQHGPYEITPRISSWPKASLPLMRISPTRVCTPSEMT